MSCLLAARRKFLPLGIMCRFLAQNLSACPLPLLRKAASPQTRKRCELNTCLCDQQPRSSALVRLLGGGHQRPVRFCVVEQNRCGREEEEEGNSCSPHRSRFPSLTGRRFSRGPSGLRSSGSEGDFYGGGETRNGPELAGFFPSQGQALVFSVSTMLGFVAKVAWTQRICTSLFLCVSFLWETAQAVYHRFWWKGSFVLLNRSWAEGSRPEASVPCVCVYIPKYGRRSDKDRL